MRRRKTLFVCLSLALCDRVASEKRQLIEPEHVHSGSLHQCLVPLETMLFWLLQCRRQWGRRLL